MKINSTYSDAIDQNVWIQTAKYVAWGALAAVLQDMCMVMHGIRYFACF